MTETKEETAFETANRLNKQLFGALMRKLRTDADMKRSDFAIRVGCSGPLISQTESGINPPNAKIEALLCELYPAEAEQISRLASTARLSSGSHASDFQKYVRWNRIDRAA